MSIYISIYIHLYIYIYIYIYIYKERETVVDEKITLRQYATQSFMFCTFDRYTFLLKLFHTVR